MGHTVSNLPGPEFRTSSASDVLALACRRFIVDDEVTQHAVLRNDACALSGARDIVGIQTPHLTASCSPDQVPLEHVYRAAESWAL